MTARGYHRATPPLSAVHDREIDVIAVIMASLQHHLFIREFLTSANFLEKKIQDHMKRFDLSH